MAFALAMALVLAATGAFLYVRLGASLDEAIDESLSARAAELAPRVASGQTDLGGGLGDADERFYQLLDERGAVLAGTPELGGAPLPDPHVLLAVDHRFELDEAPGVGVRARVLSTRVETPDGTRTLRLGASLEDRDEATRGFLTELLLVGPAALVLASLLGYALATAALRPVEAMRAEAEAVSGTEPGRRLPLPRSRDEVHRLGETLNEMLARLESALERERGFVADAGHELRTPLALLKTELELALRRPRTVDELEAAVRSAAGESDRLARLAENLLLLARSDQRRLDLRRETVLAADLLSTVAARFSGRAEAAGRVITVAAPAELELDADPLRLEQAIGNLVENALNHGLGSIRLTAVELDGGVGLHVTDGGGGFGADFLPRAFDRFSRADDARSGGGAGLGLTIAEAIARAHGGSAHAANRPGGGADVWILVPRG